MNPKSVDNKLLSEFRGNVEYLDEMITYLCKSLGHDRSKNYNISNMLEKLASLKAHILGESIQDPKKSVAATDDIKSFEISPTSSLGEDFEMIDLPSPPMPHESEAEIEAYHKTFSKKSKKCL